MISIIELDGPKFALSSLKTRTDTMCLDIFSDVTSQVPEIPQLIFF